MDRSQPTLSIVVGSSNARATILECLEALESQAARAGAQILVVDNSTDGTPALVERHFPGVELVASPATPYIPQLWASGVARSTGDIVAITTAHCVPAHDWVEHVLAAHDGDWAAIGGAIENREPCGLVDWAIYFCRYTPYMLPFESRVVEEVAGDNASYKRSALEQSGVDLADGFWEPVVHAKLRRSGFQLALTPRIVVRHARSYTFAGFVRQRFWHGRQFGSSRGATFTVARRLAYGALSPLIPLLFLGRIARRVHSKRRHAREFVLGLPALLAFLASWSAGEMSGYLWPIK